jgi:hypothetical protein
MAGVDAPVAPTLPDQDVLSDEQLREMFDDELRCQVPHELVGLPCSIEVIAHGKSCRLEAHMCGVAVMVARAYMDSGGACFWCRRPAVDCWQITAI